MHLHFAPPHSHLDEYSGAINISCLRHEDHNHPTRYLAFDAIFGVESAVETYLQGSGPNPPKRTFPLISNT